VGGNRSTRINLPRARYVAVLVLVLCVAGIGAVAGVAAVTRLTETVAVVNGRAITREQLYDEMYGRIGPETLQQMIDRILVLEEARRQGVEVTQQEIGAEINRMVAEQYSSEQEFLQALSYYGMTREQLEKEWEVYLAARKVLLPRIQVSEEEVQSYFRENRHEFDEEESVRLRQIVVGTEDEARKVLAELKAGADFATLARERSIDAATREEGGDLGVVHRGELVPELEEVAFALKVGELSDPIQGFDGFYIVQVVEKKGAREVSLEEVRDRVIDRLKADKFQEMFPGWLEELRSSARVEYRSPR